MHIRSIVIILPVVLLFPSCKTQVDQSAEERKLLETDRKFSQRSLETNAAEAFHEYFADSAISLPGQSEPVRGNAAIYERMKKHAGEYTLRWEPQSAEVAASGDLGYTWGKAMVTEKDSLGRPQFSYEKYVSIWKKQPDGNWKVILDIGNPSPPPASQQ